MCAKLPTCMMTKQDALLCKATVAELVLKAVLACVCHNSPQPYAQLFSGSW